MAESKTEQAKQKAAEVRDAVAKQSEIAEQKVKESVKAAENSAVGRRIPTSLDSMTFRDIVKMTFFLNSILSLGLYCISASAATDAEGNLSGFFLNTSNYMIAIFGIGGIVADGLFFFAHLFAFFKVLLLIKILKLVGMVLFIFSGHRDTWLMMITTYLYAAFCVFLDLCYIYYLIIYEERLHNDDYDENGMLKRDKKEEEP